MRAHFAADRADVETLRRLLAAGLSPDAEYDGTPVVWNGKTPLLTLCIAWHDDAGDRVGCFKLLRDAGANLDATDSVARRHTALHYAAVNGDATIVSLLVEAGANVNAADSIGWTALHRAAHGRDRESTDCVEVLLAAGASVNARSLDIIDEVWGQTGTRPLDIAISEDYRRAWPLILRAGAEIPTNNTDPYIVRVRNADGWKKYAQAHLARVTDTFEPKLPMLPKELVRHVVSFWLHAGYY